MRNNKKTAIFLWSTDINSKEGQKFYIAGQFAGHYVNKNKLKVGNFGLNIGKHWQLVISVLQRNFVIWDM